MFFSLSFLKRFYYYWHFFINNLQIKNKHPESIKTMVMVLGIN